MEKSVFYNELSVFTQKIDKGNPAAVVLGANQYTESQMQAIAKQIGFNETTFVLESAHSDYRLRYFSPESEMQLCGHGTLAASSCLMQKKAQPPVISYETLAGEIFVFKRQTPEGTRLMMQQKPAKFETFGGDLKMLANVLGITVSGIDQTKPIVYASTGTWTLLVPVVSRHVIETMVPNNAAFPKVLSTHPTISIHPFCLEPRAESSTVYGRHFSSAYAGTKEDAVTGTANGALGAYYKHYIDEKITEIVIEQGYELGREGQVFVQVGKHLDVTISGEVSPIVKKEIKI